MVLCSRGVDLNEFHPQPPHSGLVQEFGIAKETKVILTVANLVLIPVGRSAFET